MQLFYNPNILATDTSVTFSKEESRHMVKVLRKNQGDTIYTTNGKGQIFTLQLTITNPKHCEAQVVSVEEKLPLSYQLHMAVAPTKLNDRYEWFLEKATEIGIAKVTPLLCERSERKQVKLERYEKIVVSASKQALKAYKPEVQPIVKFKDFINSHKDFDGLKCIAHCEDQPKAALKSVIDDRKNILVLIGPEGDFSTNEIEFATKAGFVPVSLGGQRLRTETAAIVACHTISLLKS